MKFGRIVLRVNTQLRITLPSRISRQDGGHEVRAPLPASPSSACDVTGSLYALQFLIDSTSVLVDIRLLKSVKITSILICPVLAYS